MTEELDLLSDSEDLLPEISLLDEPISPVLTNAESLSAPSANPVQEPVSSALTSDDLLPDDLGDLLPADPLSIDGGANDLSSLSGGIADLLPDDSLASVSAGQSDIMTHSEPAAAASVLAAPAVSLDKNLLVVSKQAKPAFDQTDESQAIESPKQKRRATAQKLLRAKIPASKGEIAKGVVVATLLSLALIAIETRLFIGDDKIEAQQSLMVDQRIAEFEAKPLRLLGGQEILLVKGRLKPKSATGNVVADKLAENYSHYQVEVAILAPDKETIIAKEQVPVGTTYKEGQLAELSKNGKIVGPLANTKDNHFELALSAAKLKEPLSVLLRSPERLRVNVLEP